MVRLADAPESASTQIHIRQIHIPSACPLSTHTLQGTRSDCWCSKFEEIDQNVFLSCNVKILGSYIMLLCPSPICCHGLHANFKSVIQFVVKLTS